MFGSSRYSPLRDIGSERGNDFGHSFCVRVGHLLDEVSESQQGAEGRGEVRVVQVVGVCVHTQSLKQNYVLLYSPHRTQQQLLQTSQKTHFNHAGSTVNINVCEGTSACVSQEFCPLSSGKLETKVLSLCT